jgi:hypothetical protein
MNNVLTQKLKNSIRYAIVFTLISCTTLVLAAQESISFAILIAPIGTTYTVNTWNKTCEKIAKYNLDHADNNHTLGAIHDGIDLAKEIITFIKSDKTLLSIILINIDPKVAAQNEKINNYTALEFKIVNENYDSSVWQSLQKETELLIRYCETTPNGQFDYDYYFDAIKDIFKKAHSE